MPRLDTWNQELTQINILTKVHMTSLVNQKLTSIRYIAANSASIAVETVVIRQFITANVLLTDTSPLELTCSNVENLGSLDSLGESG